MGKLKDYKGQSESNTSYILSPYILFVFLNGNNHYISEVLEHTQSYHISHNCFAQHLVAELVYLKQFITLQSHNVHK